MPTTHYWTSKDLELFPKNDGKRYEIIDGELYVSIRCRQLHSSIHLAPLRFLRSIRCLESWPRPWGEVYPRTGPHLCRRQSSHTRCRVDQPQPSPGRRRTRPAI